VKDTADMLDSINTLNILEDNTLPASINVEFTAQDNADILATTKDYCYWWKLPPGGEEEMPRVTQHIISCHFRDYFKVVS
jgi:hypothetical protein